MGRWLNRDPIAERGGVNMYGMVSNDVVNKTDFLGHQANPNPVPDTYQNCVDNVNKKYGPLINGAANQAERWAYTNQRQEEIDACAKRRPPPPHVNPENPRGSCPCKASAFFGLGKGEADKEYKVYNIWCKKLIRVYDSQNTFSKQWVYKLGGIYQKYTCVKPSSWVKAGDRYTKCPDGYEPE